MKGLVNAKLLGCPGAAVGSKLELPSFDLLRPQLLRFCDKVDRVLAAHRPALSLDLVCSNVPLVVSLFPPLP
jgi:hypothetical protein